MLLEELEDEINRWQKDFAPTASASSVHDDSIGPRSVEMGGNRLTSRLKFCLSCSAVLVACLGVCKIFNRGFFNKAAISR